MSASDRVSALLKNLALLIASVVFALLLGELLARMFVSGSPQTVSLPKDETAVFRLIEEGKNREGVTREGRSSEPIFVDTSAGRRLRANAHVRIKHFMNRREIDFRTNSIGYRNREIGAKTLTRALFLGDSITGGDYLQEPETFVRQVEALSWKTDRPLETINAGVGAISLANELAILEETGIATKPDIVVLCFYLNDFNESFGFWVGRLPGWLNRSYLAWLLVRGLNIAQVEVETHGDFGRASLLPLREEIARRYDPGSGNALESRRAFFAAVSKNIMDWGSAWSEQLWGEMTPLFEHFRALADEHGFEPLIVVFPVDLQARAEFLENYPQRKVAEIGKRLGIPVLDVLPVLRAQEDKEALFYDQCHYTPAGNRLLAKEILSFIQANATVRATREIPAELRGESPGAGAGAGGEITPAAGGEVAPVSGAAAAGGRTLYRRYCASCHGVLGGGDGPVAPVLEDPPRDLRLLGDRYGRPLPGSRIMAFIDGRERVRAHGDREMPVWGTRFNDLPEEGEAREARVRERLSQIAAYLETIQRPPGGGEAPAGD